MVDWFPFKRDGKSGLDERARRICLRYQRLEERKRYRGRPQDIDRHSYQYREQRTTTRLWVKIVEHANCAVNTEKKFRVLVVTQGKLQFIRDTLTLRTLIRTKKKLIEPA